MNSLFKTGLIVILIMFSQLVHAVNPKTYIPKNAIPLIPIIKDESVKFFPELPVPHYFPALIEQESCISLTHSKCFNSRSKLSTTRELGIGVGQITKAYNKDGSIRFDSLSDMVKAHNEELHELSWSNVEERVDLQIRTMILMTRDNDKRLKKIPDPVERLKFDDSAYNTGVGNVNKFRLQCSLRKGCDPNKWFGNVAENCTLGKKALYGTRTACDINLEHVDNVFNLRLDKYKPYFN